MEAIMMIMDNSLQSSNQDWKPDRFESQAESIRMLINKRTSMNHETTIGLITLCGTKGPELVIPLTSDAGKAYSLINKIKKCNPKGDILLSMKLAMLALKHRPNRNSQQRIICFIGSNICASYDNLLPYKQMGKTLRKNGICLDVVVMNEHEINNPLVKPMFTESQAPGGDKFSSYVEIYSNGKEYLSDIIKQNAIYKGEPLKEVDESQLAGMDEIDRQLIMDGFDPEEDPELYMAMRLSIIESQQTREQ